MTLNISHEFKIFIASAKMFLVTPKEQYAVLTDP